LVPSLAGPDADGRLVWNKPLGETCPQTQSGEALCNGASIALDQVDAHAYPYIRKWTVRLTCMAANYQYRVTKFDPANRDPAGRHTAEDWCMYSQIGKIFRGIVLTEDEYLRVESAYIATALDFYSEAGQPDIFAMGVEDHKARGAPPEGSLVSADRLPVLCRAMLREEYWLRIEGDDFFIHFGRDFYMYLGAPTPCERSLNKARSLGLFPEPFVSPYLPAPIHGNSLHASRRT
jgi:hypothetical protein